MNNVFINRTLNMKKINYIGLDMDHTLIRYNSRNFEELAHKIMLQKLVDDLEYPKSILNLKFDFNRAIRGLVIDKNTGNILKLSRYGAIRQSYHGLRQIKFKEQKKMYKSTYIDLSDPNYDTVDTTFSIAFAGLFAQLVDLKDKEEYHNLPEYNVIATDLTRVLDRAHKDGSLKSVVVNNLSDFIIKDPEVVQSIEKYKKHGKAFFIVTNSEFYYTKQLLDYAINPFLEDGKTWLDLFEIVITSARKPRFFFDDQKFLKIDPDTGHMTNMSGPLRAGVYQGGCAQIFTDDLELEAGEILYVGDHIYGDVVRLKKDCAWRTALIVEELEQEIESIKLAQPFSNQITELMSKKIPIEVQLDELISEKIEQKKDNDKKINKLMTEVEKIDAEISPLIKKQVELFNPHWGEVMRVGIEESYLAYQIERFACIYMPKLTDLLAMSPRTYFRSAKRLLPHDGIINEEMVVT